ncbi:hypothetical protein ACLMJK_005461 [Lecanora helva]
MSAIGRTGEGLSHDVQPSSATTKALMEAVNDSNITGPLVKAASNPINILTFLLGQPETPSFHDGYNDNPSWFSPSLQFLVSGSNPEASPLTFEQLKYLVKSLAAGLRKNGLQPGDRLLFISPEHMFMPVMLLATIAAGGIFVGRSPYCPAEQQAIVLKQCDPVFIVTYTGFEDTVAEAARVADNDAQICAFDDDPFINDLRPHFGYAHSVSTRGFLDSKGASSFRWKTLQTEADAETTALIIYTTGTTGEPKGVEFSHKNLVINCTLHEHMFPPSNRQEGRIHNFSTALWGGISAFLYTLRSRHRFLVYDIVNFELKTFLNCITTHKCNIIWATKQAIDAMANHTPRHDLAHISSIYTAGAFVSQATRQAVNNFVGKNVLRVCYALTEAGGTISIEMNEAPVTRSSSVGKLLPHVEGLIIDNDANRLDKHQEGCLIWRTPTAAKCYWRDSTTTKYVFLPLNWIDSGDLGYFDEEGMLHITGRAKEVLKVHDRPVNPFAIEETLIQMPGISHACVVGVQDIKGEVLLRAYVVRTDTKSAVVDDNDGMNIDSLVIEEDVHAFMAKSMSPDHQLTGEVVFVADDWLPYNEEGKVLRQELKERAQREYDVKHNYR